MSRFIEDEGLDLEIIDHFYSFSESNTIFQELKRIQYESVSFNMGGKICTPRRRIAAFSDSNISYPFSGLLVKGKPWTPLMLKLKENVQRKTGDEYNFALLNFYNDGQSYISQHQDSEECLAESCTIPTLSFGCMRRMLFKRDQCWTQSISLKDGSLLVMKPPTNIFWTHGIPPMKDAKHPRISVTFRQILKWD